MMSISEHERQGLETIENDLATTGPELAAMLAIFARLTAGEEMPVRERVRRAFTARSEIFMHGRHPKQGRRQVGRGAIFLPLNG